MIRSSIATAVLAASEARKRFGELMNDEIVASRQALMRDLFRDD